MENQMSQFAEVLFAKLHPRLPENNVSGYLQPRPIAA
jgi:hypothetical protein